ncbi:cytochrome P450 94A2-like [Triticum dicoccoides]|uniref:cytochrome P450 94A2-like n=1 Tax=Triticum dicoccoides TaxID=85692 RepID=UPI00188EC43C|nr:cytochrome P450 94A2-like [Triticum dicoccoides]
MDRGRSTVLARVAVKVATGFPNHKFPEQGSTMEIAHLAYVLLFLFAAVVLYVQRRRVSPSTKPRTAYCPHPNPVLGNTVEFIRNRGRFFDWYADMLRASPSNTIEAWGALGASHAVTTADPAAVDHLLRASFANYNRGAQFRAAQSDLIGDGLLGADGRLWSLQRKLASYAFSSRSLRRFSEDVLAVHLGRRFLPFLDAAAGSGEVVDLQEALRRFAFDNICYVAFGVESSTLLEWGDPRHQALFAAFDTAVEISFMRTLTAPTPVRKLTKLLNIGKSRRLREAVGVIDDHAMSVIEAKEVSQRNSRDEGDPDLLSRFMAAMDEEDGGGELAAMFPTPEAKRRFLRDVVVSFVLAGKDTTTSALTWFFWLLAANPRCERRVHDEVSRSPDGNVKGMHYLHAAITEAMRLYPPVPFNGRVAVADDVLPDGTAVRAGWYANYSAYAMGRMEKLWGENFLEFAPERWLGDSGEFAPVDAARYPVFHAGPRACLGKEMAYMQMKTVASAVLRRFRLDVVAPTASMESPPAYEMTGTMKIKGGLQVQLRMSDANKSSLATSGSGQEVD